MRPLLLLITGAPASGKTQLAGRLAARYEALCCSKDEIKELLFDTLGARDAEWSRQLSDASFALLFSFASRLLSVQRLLIMEGNFRTTQHAAPLAAVLSATGAELAQILCRADEACCAARLAARAADPRRHPGHREQAFDSSTRGASDFIDLPGPRWVLRSDSGADSDFASLCRQIDAWCGAAQPRLSKQ
jgi:predicted kinase